jgi:hypothetical protein
MSILRTTPILLAVLLSFGCGKSNSESSHSPEPEAEIPASPAAAASAAKVPEGADGTITATVNGDRKTWYILRRKLGDQLRSQSEWNSVFGAGTQLVTLFGHASADSMVSDRAFILELSTVESRDSAVATAPGIQYLVKDELSSMYNSDPPGKVEVEITEHEVDGDVLTIAGTFAGVLHPSTDGSQPEQMTVEDGVFRAQVHRAADDR